ncbi:MAG: TolB family protein [Gemmatimonadaceae bacterium]
MPSSASAQYFGRNKVQYENFDWRVLHSPRFDVHFYPAESLLAADVSRMAERWHTRLTPALRDTFDRRSIILYANSPDFQQTNVVSGLIGEGTGGVTESIRGRVTMPGQSTYGETDHVLGHELVHVYQYVMAFGGDQPGAARGFQTIPLWATEGMAEYFSVGRNDPHTAMWMRDAVRRDDMPTLRDLSTNPRYFPYRFGQAFWAWFGGVFGDAAIERVYRTAIRQGWEQSIRAVTGLPSDSLGAAWQRATSDHYLPLVAGRAAPDSIGRPVVSERSEGEQNVSPAVSPDGRLVAFFSSRDLFGFTIYVADANTGRIVKKLSSVGSDEHFDALSFIASAGTWSPDGERLAFVVQAQGDNEIDIFNQRSGDIERRIRVSGVDAISDPAWSPDGTQLAFSGNAGGMVDLYLMTLESGELRQLTRGRPAELQPAWSPDGRTIAFTTEAGPDTDESRLAFGEPRLATLDVASGQVRLMNTPGGGKQINPQFSPDGRDLFFISDQDGFSDIYRMTLASGDMFRVTRVATGVSGITKYSPALSVASGTGRLLFSVFHRGGYTIRGLEAAETQGEPVGAPSATVAEGGLLPPSSAQTGTVARYLADETTGLPPASDDYDVSDYRPKLALDYIGVPTAGVGVGGPFGTAVSGAAAAYFADELNNRIVGVGIQANGTVKDIGGQLFYMNRQHRWNWMAGAGRTTQLYMSSVVYPDAIDTGGEQIPVIAYEQRLYRQSIDEISAGVAYPLSVTRRVEFGAGLQRYGFDVEFQRLLVNNGIVVGQEQGELPTEPALKMGQVSAALVGDYSYFGFTSPIAGGRYRFEAAPTFGDLTFQTLTADYRRYLFFRPVTFAFRALHVGRYGRDSDDRRLELFLGYPTLVRGYEQGSMDISECTGISASNNSCPQFERLLGSRVAVLNAEIRVPLFGSDQLGIFSLPFLPTELSLFTDAGAAWTGAENVDLRFERNSAARIPVVSSGVSARFNLFGYTVVEVYYAHPFQRPSKSGVFGFQLSPGW